MMVPAVRIELTAYRLQGDCSTAELSRPDKERTMNKSPNASPISVQMAALAQACQPLTRGLSGADSLVYLDFATISTARRCLGFSARVQTVSAGAAP